jgi:L-aminopeptidase/D-esterase-like protein
MAVPPSLAKVESMNAISRRDLIRSALGAALLPWPVEEFMQAQRDTPERRPSLTDVEGVLVGHYTYQDRPTGCTVVTSADAFAAGVDVRGGAPGTRETDLLRAENLVDRINSVFLSGGSAFGLDTAGGISRFLEEQGRGYATASAKVPIVCGAILYDLGLGDPKIRPDARAGFEAARIASSDPVAEGNVGAGAGCTVGKLLGMGYAMKAGLGSWSIRLPDGLTVGALAAVNAVGDIIDPASGKIIAGARKADGHGFADSMEQLRKGARPGSPVQRNTVLGVVATNADLEKPECNKVAQMAQDALARCIVPAHTPSDGDTVFAVATGRKRGSFRPADLGLIGALAADVLATAIVRGITQAVSWGPYPAARDYTAKK